MGLENGDQIAEKILRQLGYHQAIGTKSFFARLVIIQKGNAVFQDRYPEVSAQARTAHFWAAVASIDKTTGRKTK